MRGLLSFNLLETANRSLSSHYFPLIYNRRAGEPIAAACFSPRWDRMGASLEICIYMIRLSSLLDLDIYFPLKGMFDYTLIKNRRKKTLSWLGLSDPAQLFLWDFCVMK